MRNSRGKHSFIQFYPDAWQSGTAHMSRLVRSIYFDICLFNWDKVRSVSPARMELMFADVANWPASVEVLLEDGQLERDKDGGIFSPRAMLEGQKAFDAYSAKSRGGKGGKGKTDEGEFEQSSKTGATKADSAATKQPQREIEIETETEIPPEGEEGAAGAAPPPTLTAKDVVEEWNIMASKAGLSQVAKMTDERSKRLRARIDDHGADAIIEAIRKMPENPFFLGRNDRKWKATFDWLLSPKYCIKLIEGGYDQGRGKGSAWLD